MNCTFCGKESVYLYQRDYVVPDQPGIMTQLEKGIPISPRCSACYDKAVKEAKKKEVK